MRQPQEVVGDAVGLVEVALRVGEVADVFPAGMVADAQNRVDATALQHFPGAREGVEDDLVLDAKVAEHLVHDVDVTAGGTSVLQILKGRVDFSGDPQGAARRRSGGQ